MGGIFKSTEPAFIVVRVGVGQTLPLAFGSPVYQTIEGLLSDNTLFIKDQANNILCNAAANALPTGITYAAGGGGGVFMLRLDPTTFAANAIGTILWTVTSNANSPLFDAQWGSFQWGGIIDLLAQGAADSTNAYGDTQAIKQATLGACTFDPATGYVTFTSSGDHFRLIDSNGAAVSSPQNATGRDNTTQ